MYSIQQIVQALRVVAYQLYCTPVALGRDFECKRGDLIGRAQSRGRVEPIPPPPGSNRSVYIGPGWNQDCEPFVELANVMAKRWHAGRRMMVLPPKCGHTQTLSYARHLNKEDAQEMLIEDYLELVPMYSRFGLYGTQLIHSMVFNRDGLFDRQYDPSRIKLFYIAVPIMGSHAGAMQYEAMKVLRSLRGQHPRVLRLVQQFLLEHHSELGIVLEELLRPEFLDAMEAAAEMVPGAPVLEEVQQQIYELEQAGVSTVYTWFHRDGLVMKEQSAPPWAWKKSADQQPKLIKDSCGHCSMSIPRALINLLRIIEEAMLRERLDLRHLKMAA